MPMPMHFWLVGIDLEAGGMNISEAHQRWWSPFPIRDLILGTPAGLPRTRRALEMFSRKRLKHGSSKTQELLWPNYFHRGDCFSEALSAIITFKNTYISIPGLIILHSVYDYMQSLFQNVPFAFNIEPKSFAECTVTEIHFLELMFYYNRIGCMQCGGFLL